MRINSVLVKLPVIILLGFILLSLLVQSIVQQQLTSLINQGQEEVYNEKLQTALRTIQQNYDRLQRTGMVDNYWEDFQQLTLKQLQNIHFQTGNGELLPFVIDAAGRQLLSPAKGPIDHQLFRQQIQLQGRGTIGGGFALNVPEQGEFWCVFRTFEPWNWSIGYLVPYAVKYRVVSQLKQILWLVFVGATVVVVLVVVWLVRMQLKPVTTLTAMSAEMAQGNLQRRIHISQKDEIGDLANHFNRMQYSIQQTIESLRSSEENLRTTLNSIGDAVIATNVKLHITRINPVAATLTGWSAEDAVDQPLERVFHVINGKTRELVENPAKEALLNNQTAALADNTLLIAKNGSEYQIADSAAPIHNDDGQLLGVVLVFRDVGEEKALQEQLLQSRKMDTIGQLAGGIAHDFNNMLGGIIGSAELLKRRLPPDHKTDKFLGMIMDSAERAADLTSKLLAFARKQHVSSTPVDALLALRNTLAIFTNTVDRRISINTHIQEGKGMVVGDLTQLQNVFLNLCINASQAMPEGGELSITTHNIELDKLYCDSSNFDLIPGSYLEIEFRDTGYGIPAEQLERVFEPFFTTKEQGKGTGLGLAAVLGTVQMHKGAVTVYSEVGTGTVFHVLLPLTEAEAGEVEPVVQPLSGSGLILVVDDEAVMRATAAAILEDLGYEVLLADNGRTAVEIYRERSADIDLVLLDMIMPEMNGSDCFAALQQINSQVKIVLSSGFTRSDDLTELRAAGLVGFIRKPYRGVALSRTVAAALGGKDAAEVLWAR